MAIAVMMCFSPVLLAHLAQEEVEVGSLLEGQEDVLLKRSRQRRGVDSTINKTEVIELMVYVDKLMYDRYQQNEDALERHILAILNLVCACMCINVGVYWSLQEHLHAVYKGNVLMYTYVIHIYARCVLMCVCPYGVGGCVCACACMRVCVRACVHACVCACVCTCTHVCSVCSVCAKGVKDECCVQNPNNMKIATCSSPLPPQFAAIMQEPSIGWPIYIKVVRIIIEVKVVSGLAI